MQNDRYIALVVNEFISDKVYLKKSTVFNTNFEIIDSIGQKYLIKELNNPIFSLFLSIKYVGCIYKVDPIYDYVDTVSLDDLKERVLKHVDKNRKLWKSVDDGRGIARMIKEASSYEEVILMFKKYLRNVKLKKVPLPLIKTSVSILGQGVTDRFCLQGKNRVPRRHSIGRELRPTGSQHRPILLERGKF